jgi:nitrogen fixation-related uncharacterized protein
MNNPMILIIPVGALIVAVILIGALWWWWTGEQDDTEPENPALPDVKKEIPVTEGEFLKALTNRVQQALAWVQTKGRTVKLPGAAQASMGTGSTQVLHANAESVEVLRVYRDLTDGGLIVEMSGRQYRDASEMTDQQVQRRFITLAQSLVHFGGVMPAPSISSELPAPPISTSPVQPSAESTESDEVNAALSGQLSMADQIEEVLQEHLMGLSHFNNRSIHIRANPDGSVRVEVDDQVYDGIGDVTDPEVRDLLQTVIREWEKRQ